MSAVVNVAALDVMFARVVFPVAFNVVNVAAAALVLPIVVLFKLVNVPFVDDMFVIPVKFPPEIFTVVNVAAWPTKFPEAFIVVKLAAAALVPPIAEPLIVAPSIVPPLMSAVVNVAALDVIFARVVFPVAFNVVNVAAAAVVPPIAEPLIVAPSIVPPLMSAVVNVAALDVIFARVVFPVAFNVVNVAAAAVVPPIAEPLIVAPSIVPPLMSAVVNVAAFAVIPALTVKAALFTIAPLPAVKAPVEANTTSPAEPSIVNAKPLFVIVVALFKVPPNSIVPELFVIAFAVGIAIIASLTAFSVTNLVSEAVPVALTEVRISSTLAPASNPKVPFTVWLLETVTFPPDKLIPFASVNVKAFPEPFVILPLTSKPSVSFINTAWLPPAELNIPFVPETSNPPDPPTVKVMLLNNALVFVKFNWFPEVLNPFCDSTNPAVELIFPEA